MVRQGCRHVAFRQTFFRIIFLPFTCTRLERDPVIQTVALEEAPSATENTRIYYVRHVYVGTLKSI